MNNRDVRNERRLRFPPVSTEDVQDVGVIMSTRRKLAVAVEVQFPATNRDALYLKRYWQALEWKIRIGVPAGFWASISGLSDAALDPTLEVELFVISMLVRRHPLSNRLFAGSK